MHSSAQLYMYTMLMVWLRDPDVVAVVVHKVERTLREPLERNEIPNHILSS